MILRSTLLAFSLLAAPAWAGTAVALKPVPTDSDGVVTLGDLFEGAGSASAVVVAPGPKGQASVVLDSARVQAVARSAGLSWANPAGVRRIAVRGGAAPAPAAAIGAVAPATAGTTEALVYARSLKTGEVVAAEDLTWAPVSSRLLPREAPQDAEALIGLAARKPLRAGAPAQGSDLSAAMAIKKDDAVSVHFRSGGVALMLHGKALSAAAEGGAVRILNPQSKMIIEAIAAGPGLAVVGRDADSLKAARLASNR